MSFFSGSRYYKRMYDETFVIAAGARGMILLTIVHRSSFTGGTASVLRSRSGDNVCHGSIEAAREISASCLKGRQPWDHLGRAFAWLASNVFCCRHTDSCVRHGNEVRKETRQARVRCRVRYRAVQATNNNNGRLQKSSAVPRIQYSWRRFCVVERGLN